MTDKKTPVPATLLDDDISDAELDAITRRMLKNVLARKAQAQRKLDSDLAAALAQAKIYFSQPKAN